jgi:ABC-type nickel/cobalt efflux system permease component RcnA
MNTFASRLLTVLCTLLIGGSVAAQSPIAETVKPSTHTIRLDVFVRGDSETSTQGARFARELGDRTPGLDVVVHDVLQDKSQLSRLWKLARDSGREKPVVPAFYCCDRLYFGFTDVETTGPAIESLFTADVYTRSTCPKCIAAKAFFRQLGPRWPALRIQIYEITNDVIARRRYQELCRSKGKLPGLPTIHFAGQVIIGYQGDTITGAQFENLIRKVSGADTEKPKPAPDERESSANQPRPSPFSATRLVGFWGLPQDSGSQSESDANFDDVPLPDEASDADLGEAEMHHEESQSQQESDLIHVPVFGQLRVSDLGLPLFTFLVGLVDGFNPCAMWILVFLLSVLVNIKDRRKILLIAGTFVIVSGIAYFAFMAAWLNLFMLIGIARPAQIVLGVMALLIGIVNVKDFFAFKKGISLSIPESSKPGLYRRVREIVAAKYLTGALAGVVVLAVIVNMVELLCTAGLPALYTQILTMQDLPTWKNYGYLGLYISAYMLDDTILLVIVVTTLSHRKLQEREGRWLKLISGLVILALGLVMIFKPAWLQLGQ